MIIYIDNVVIIDPSGWFCTLFLVADTQLYKRLCPSVGWLEAVIELKSGETSVLDTFCVCLSVGGGSGEAERKSQRSKKK